MEKPVRVEQLVGGLCDAHYDQITEIINDKE